MDYRSFLDTKKIQHMASGFDAEPSGFLYPFQQRIVKWAIGRGRAAIFADCGLGKTPMQLDWAAKVSDRTGRPVIIFAPLAVAQQTKHEGEKFGIGVTVCRSQKDVRGGVNIANYEMLAHFDATAFGGIVLDESSILKNYAGATRKAITEFGQQIDFRLACTATPAPNDLVELCNHAEFLSVLSGKEIIALFFRQDGNTTHSWRLKGHARADFWRWLASWSMACRRPSDLGFDDNGFTLPKLRIHQHIVDGHVEDGYLFPVEAQTLGDRLKARRESIGERVGMCAALVNQSRDPWLVWCNLNNESGALRRAIPDSTEVKGSDPIEHKIDAMVGFTEGRYRVMITKPSIAGFGMNWQHCANMAFVGLSDSFEQFYQAVRRCWRFGQKCPVNAHVIVADTEGAVVANIQRKEKDASEMIDELVRHVGNEYVKFRDDDRYTGNKELQIPAWMRSAS